MPKEPEKVTPSSLLLSPEELVPNSPIPPPASMGFSSVSKGQKHHSPFLHLTEKKCQQGLQVALRSEYFVNQSSGSSTFLMPVL